MKNSDKLEELRRYIGLNYSQLAKELKLKGPQIFYDIKAGRCEFSRNLLKAIQEKYLINPSWILYDQEPMILGGNSVIGNNNIVANANAPHSTATINVYLGGGRQDGCPDCPSDVALISAEMARTPDLDIMQYIRSGRAKMVARMPNLPPYSICFRNQSNCMTPVIMPGDNLALQMVELGTPIFGGEIYCLNYRRSGLIIRRVYEEADGILRLVALNKDYEDVRIRKDDVFNFFRVVGQLRSAIDSNI